MHLLTESLSVALSSSKTVTELLYRTWGRGSRRSRKWNPLPRVLLRFRRTRSYRWNRRRSSLAQRKRLLTRRIRRQRRKQRELYRSICRSSDRRQVRRYWRIRRQSIRTGRYRCYAWVCPLLRACTRRAKPRIHRRMWHIRRKPCRRRTHRQRYARRWPVEIRRNPRRHRRTWRVGSRVSRLRGRQSSSRPQMWRLLSARYRESSYWT